jgi:MFS family permease
MTRFFYGYWIVLAGFVTLTLSSGLTYYGFSVMNQSVAADAEFHWSPGQVTLAFTCFAVAMAVTSPLVGRLTDKRGSRQVLIIGTIVLSLSLVLLSTISSLWSYCLLHFGLGMSMTILGAVPISVLISNWFHRRRGTMQGLSFIGLGFGGFVFGPLIRNYLIPNLGWRDTYAVLALLSAVVMTLVILFLVKNHPRDKGLSPYGAEATEIADDHRPEAGKVPGLTLKETLSKSAFWLISLTAAVYGMGLTGGLQNLERILTARPEFTAGDAAFAVGIVGLSSAAGKFVFGYLCDRIDPKYTTAMAYAFTGLSLTVLTLAHSMHHLWLYGIILGLGMGGWAPNTAMLAANYFGRRQYGTILGNIHLIFMLGEAVGPALVGRVYDQTLTYNTILLTLSILCAAAIPLIIIVRKPGLSFAGKNAPQT